MGLLDDFRELADELRDLSGPDGFDIRQTHLTIRTRVWSGGRRALGSPRDTDLALPSIYKIKQMKTDEISSSGGRYEVGDVIVGPITPPYTGGGFSEDQLRPAVTQEGTEVIYLIQGQHSGEYGLIELRSFKAFSYFLVLRRLRTTPR